MAQKLIITDLDGTLLHPKDYSFEAALPALREIREGKIPLILCSSKTRAEIVEWRNRLALRNPFVSENGGGIFIPEGTFSFPIDGVSKDRFRVILLGLPYGEIRETFVSIRDRMGIRVKGFGDMTVEEVADLTGLPKADAESAKMRDFDEPFLFESGENRTAPFLKAVEEAGLRWTEGRFFHLLGDHDKGKAFRILRDFYSRKWGSVETLALGDGFNDLPLLREADRAVLVPQADGRYDPRVDRPGLIRAAGVGPEGWNRAVLEWLAG